MTAKRHFEINWPLLLTLWNSTGNLLLAKTKFKKKSKKVCKRYYATFFSADATIFFLENLRFFFAQEKHKKTAHKSSISTYCSLELKIHIRNVSQDTSVYYSVYPTLKHHTDPIRIPLCDLKKKSHFVRCFSIHNNTYHS